jgi:hypothetical protein
MVLLLECFHHQLVEWDSCHWVLKGMLSDGESWSCCCMVALPA